MRSANFVEETTTSIAGTAGDGAITLTGIASVPRFSTVFGTQATTIRYVIEDTVGKRFETGIGSVAGNVLTRTRPQVTWNGTTYDDSTPAPVAFGSAPASGNIRVRLSATAESQGANMPGLNAALVAAGGLFQQYPMTRTLRTQNSGSAGNLVAGTLYYWVYKLDHAGLLDGMAVDVMTAGGTGLKLALYSLGTNGLPNEKIVDFNVISTSTTGERTDTATGTWAPAGPVWLQAGWYAVGGISDGACGLRGLSPVTTAVTSSPFARAGGYGDSYMISINSQSYAAGLPAVASLAGAALRGDNNSLCGAWVGLRVAP